MTITGKRTQNGILIFVSSHSPSDPPNACQSQDRRLVYSPPLSLSWWQYPCRAKPSSQDISSFTLPISEWFPRPHAFHTSRSVDSISFAKLCGLGQLVLVPQPDHHPPMPTLGDITATIGASIHGGCPDAIQTPQASADPGVLFRGRRQPSPSGRWGIFRLVAPFSVPLNEQARQSLRVRPFSSVRPSFLVLILIPLEDPCAEASKASMDCLD